MPERKTTEELTREIITGEMLHTFWRKGVDGPGTYEVWRAIDQCDGDTWAQYVESVQQFVAERIAPHLAPEPSEDARKLVRGWIAEDPGEDWKHGDEYDVSERDLDLLAQRIEAYGQAKLEEGRRLEREENVKVLRKAAQAFRRSGADGIAFALHEQADAIESPVCPPSEEHPGAY